MKRAERLALTAALAATLLSGCGHATNMSRLPNSSTTARTSGQATQVASLRSCLTWIAH
jgi:hypothetical protein